MKFPLLARHCKRLVLLLASPAALLLSQGQAKAILNINIFDEGLNLKVTVNGSLSQIPTENIGNIACSTNPGDDGLLAGEFSGLNANVICTGPTYLNTVGFAISGPDGFGGTGLLQLADAVNGSGFILFSSPTAKGFTLYDYDYSLGKPFFSSATFNGKSLSSEGFTARGLVGTWTIDGTSESINVYIGPTATPGPLPLFAAGAAFGWSRKLRRRIGTAGNTPPQD